MTNEWEMTTLLCFCYHTAAVCFVCSSPLAYTAGNGDSLPLLLLFLLICDVYSSKEIYAFQLNICWCEIYFNFIFSCSYFSSASFGNNVLYSLLEQWHDMWRTDWQMRREIVNHQQRHLQKTTHHHRRSNQKTYGRVPSFNWMKFTTHP